MVGDGFAAPRPLQEVVNQGLGFSVSGGSVLSRLERLAQEAGPGELGRIEAGTLAGFYPAEF